MIPRRVLHVLGTAQEKGTSIARFVRAFVHELDPERYRAHAWFLGGDGPLAAELSAADISVRTFRWTGDRTDISGAWRFWRDLRREPFSIVHVHFGGRAVPCLVRAATRTKIVRHVHAGGAEAGEPGPMVVRPWTADTVVVVSHALARLVEGMQPHVVHYGIQVPERRPEFAVGARGRPPMVGAASRLVPIKGLTYLIRAVADLQRECPELRVEIAGAGPDETALRDEAKVLGVEDRISFLGWRADIWSAFARWDIFVQPSLDEGLPMAVLEAMAAGLPVVGTSAGGLPELIEDGRTGYVVPPADTAALASRLRDLLLDADSRRAMGAAGHARAREYFSVRRMATELAGIYDELLSRDGDRA